MIPLTTRDAADWSMICAYLRLDDEGRKRVIEEIEYQTSRMMKEREEESLRSRSLIILPRSGSAARFPVHVVQSQRFCCRQI